MRSKRIKVFSLPSIIYKFMRAGLLHFKAWDLAWIKDPVPMCLLCGGGTGEEGEGSHTNKQFSDTSWVSYNSTQLDTIYPKIASDPQVKGSVLQDCPPPYNCQHQSQVQVVTCDSDQLTSYRLKVPTAPFLGSVDLLEQLTDLRETFYLLDSFSIIKGYNSGTARWKKCIRECMGQEYGAFILSLGAPVS